MRILVLADIHANWAALSAIVHEPFDYCLCLGDLVDYGLEPRPCIDWVMKHAHTCIRGNHDHAVSQDIVCQHASGYRNLIATTRPMMRPMLEPEHLRYLHTLPIRKQLRLGDQSMLLVHATPKDPLDEYLFRDPKAWEQRIEKVDADIILVGHTHHQFCLEIGSKLVLNPGSVGQPRDGDPRASYAIIENGQIQLKRVEYDIEAALMPFEEMQLSQESAQFAREVLISGGHSPKLMNNVRSQLNGHAH